MRKILVLLLLAFGVAVGAGAVSAVPDVSPDATIVWRESDPRFGGISGLAILDGGKRLLAIGDRGIWVTADLRRKDGKLVGVRTTAIGDLLGVDGQPLTGLETDAEGLTLDPRGRAYVSFEGLHRVRRYPSIDGRAEAVKTYAGFAKIGWNVGLEAIAMDSRGTLYAVPERSRIREPLYPVFRYRNGTWDQKLTFRRGESFLVVDAAFGPDGRFYVLERKFKRLGGFATRLRRFTLGPEGFGNEEKLFTTRFGEMDNMEGLAVWRDDQGKIRITMVSDDNFFILQRTEIREFTLPDG